MIWSNQTKCSITSSKSINNEPRNYCRHSCCGCWKPYASKQTEAISENPRQDDSGTYALSILSHPAINHVILSVGKNDPYLSEITLFPHQNITLVEGGETRAESVLNGLNAIKNDHAWVLVHDAARPCLTHQDLDKLLQIDDEQGAILAIPAVDTIKRANKQQNIIKTEDRS